MNKHSSSTSVNTPRRSPSTDHPRKGSKANIHESVYKAIVEHRLLPGTKLPEARVAELFSVSRTQVRSALQRLAAEQLVTLIPNRGAFVSTPSIDEARDVLEIRRTLEPVIVGRLIQRISSSSNAVDACTELRALVQRERASHAAGDRRLTIRLSGEFHVLIAELTGSKLLTWLMRELTPLTCLAILTFEAPLSTACPNDEHMELIEAIERGDANEAMQLMAEHLSHIEAALHLERKTDPEIDLAEILLG